MHQAGPALAGPAFLHPAEPAPQPLQNARKFGMIKAKKISRTHRENLKRSGCFMPEKESKGIKKFFEEFKAFAMRGNVLDMAVGVVIGGAFTAIVNSLVNDIINPAIGLFFNADFSDVGIHVGDVMIGIGSFINAIINFLIVAFVLFVVIKTINALHKKPAEPEAPAEPTTKVCPYCQSEISIKAVRCPHCTSKLEGFPEINN